MSATRPKVLIITYYWPPSGGAGVQRWLKLTKYMARAGVDPVVLTVDPRHACYPLLDPSLEADVAAGVRVHRTRAFNPIALGERLMGRAAAPRVGFTPAGGSRLAGLLATVIRTHLFIPDPRRGWNGYALRRALAIVAQERPSVVITTGPPHSTHLVGLALRRRTGICWIADFRDPWTDIHYYSRMGHSGLTRWCDARLERRVLRGANGIVAVSAGLADLLSAKLDAAVRPPIEVIPNGFDPDDFPPPQPPPPSPPYTITYLGSIAGEYNPSGFLAAVGELIRQGKPYRLRFVGTVDPQVMAMIQAEGLAPHTERLGPVPHSRVGEHLHASHALLLVIPPAANDRLILTGKLFEYLAARRPIVALGPPQGDAAAIIRACGAGRVFAHGDREGLMEYLRALPLHPQAQPNAQEIARYSRARQCEQLIGFARRVRGGL